jgi:hypothetical protein
MHFVTKEFYVPTATFLSLRDPHRSVSVNQKSYTVTSLTVSVTSASAERSFSKLKSVKTVMRSVMNQERLGELLTLCV